MQMFQIYEPYQRFKTLIKPWKKRLQAQQQIGISSNVISLMQKNPIKSAN